MATPLCTTLKTAAARSARNSDSLPDFRQQYKRLFFMKRSPYLLRLPTLVGSRPALCMHAASLPGPERAHAILASLLRFTATLPSLPASIATPYHHEFQTQQADSNPYRFQRFSATPSAAPSQYL
jgi:hypothetical protein